MNTNEKNTFNEQAKRGFTLIEILVAVAIIGIMGTIAVQSVTGYIAKTHVTAAEQGVQALKESCAAYFMQHKKFPSNLDQLTEGDDPILESDKYLYDPWDNKYEMEVKGKRIIIKSAGEDGQMGTEDDITSADKKKQNG